MRSFGTTIATGSLAVLVVGLAWPHLAGRLLQMLIAALAMSYVGHRLYRSGLPKALAGDTYTPFEARASRRPPGGHPPAISRLTTLLTAADDAETADRVAIPGVVREVLTDEASRRLAEHRGLHLRDPSDQPRIRAIVSDATWALLRPRTEFPKSSPYGEAVSLSHLERVLDDLERL